MLGVYLKKCVQP